MTGRQHAFRIIWCEGCVSLLADCSRARARCFPWRARAPQWYLLKNLMMSSASASGSSIAAKWPPARRGPCIANRQTGMHDWGGERSTDSTACPDNIRWCASRQYAMEFQCHRFQKLDKRETLLYCVHAQHLQQVWHGREERSPFWNSDQCFRLYLEAAHALGARKSSLGKFATAVGTYTGISNYGYVHSHPHRHVCQLLQVVLGRGPCLARTEELHRELCECCWTLQKQQHSWPDTWNTSLCQL